MKPSPLLLQDRFSDLLQRTVHKLTVRGSQARGCCPFHEDHHPSFSADIEKGVFHCFGCGVSGGIKAFAELVGETWTIPPLMRREKARAAVSIQRREAEAKARAILQNRTDERLDAIFAEWREANTDAANAADLLGLFHRHPDLAEEFSDLATQAERDYSETVTRRGLLEARMDGEVE